MRNLEKDWATCQDEFLEGIQHIVGKRGAILAFSTDPNLNSANGTSGAGANSSSAASVSSLSLMSSRRHSYIDYEIDSLRQDVDDLREDNDRLRKDLDMARSDAEEARLQLQVQMQQQQEKEQQQKSRSGMSPSHSKDLREASDSEPPTSYGKREVNEPVSFSLRWVYYFSSCLAAVHFAHARLLSFVIFIRVLLFPGRCFFVGRPCRIQNHAGVVQRLVQKEKEVAQLRETIEKMEKKYKDKAELVTVSFVVHPQRNKYERRDGWKKQDN